MPAVTIAYPKGLFDPAEKAHFKHMVKDLVAIHMDAINPDTEEMTEYGDDPDSYIDLLLVPYDPDDAELTTPMVATIVTYAWPDRMATLGGRIKAITRGVRISLPSNIAPDPDEEMISFTFLGKADGAWFAA
jgi:hypothetical protein